MRQAGHVLVLNKGQSVIHTLIHRCVYPGAGRSEGHTWTMFGQVPPCTSFTQPPKKVRKEGSAGTLWLLHKIFR